MNERFLLSFIFDHILCLSIVDALKNNSYVRVCSMIKKAQTNHRICSSACRKLSIHSGFSDYHRTNILNYALRETQRPVYLILTELSISS